MRKQVLASILLYLAHTAYSRRLHGDHLSLPSDVEQVNHIYALIGGAPLASLGALPASPLEALAGSVPQVIESVKSFQARSQVSSGCRKLSSGRTLKLAAEDYSFPLSALSPGALPPDASYFDLEDPMLWTGTLGPSVAQAQMVERLQLGAPVFQQMERPVQELPLLGEDPAAGPGPQRSLELTQGFNSAGQPCEQLPLNIFAALARDGYVNK